MRAQPGKARVRVSSCGVYTFLYTVDTGACAGVDTVVVNTKLVVMVVLVAVAVLEQTVLM